jgi:hypothetical protein
VAGAVRISSNAGTFISAATIIDRSGAESRICAGGSTNANLSLFTAQTSLGGAAERVRITSTGHVGIGTTSPGYKLTVVDSSAVSVNTLWLDNDFGGSSDLVESNIVLGGRGQSRAWGRIGGKQRVSGSYSDGVMHFYTYSGDAAHTTPDMTIYSNGNVGIGTAAPNYQLQLSTDTAGKLSSNTWTITSDSRLKTVLGEYSKGLAEICQVRPVRYQYNGLGGLPADGKEQISVLAQEIMTVFPECVGTFRGRLAASDTEDTELYNYDGHAITFALINAVRELKAEIDLLKSQQSHTM